MANISSTQTPWDFPIQFLKGVGERIAQVLADADIRTYWDLLLFLPRSFEDRRHFHTANEIRDLAGSGQSIVALGRIEKYSIKKAGPRGRAWLEATVMLEGGTGYLIFTWFHMMGGTIQKRFPEGSHVVFRGKPQAFRNMIQIVHPEMQKSEGELPWWEFGSWIPVYRETGGLSTRQIRKIMAHALMHEMFQKIPESLPVSLTQRLALPPLKDSIREMHFPKTWTPMEDGDFKPEGPFFTRIVFEELFAMALALHFRRAQLRIEGRLASDRIPRLGDARKKLPDYLALLPFKLTGDQLRAVDEVFADLACEKEVVPMHRLVQGDVGSGKTAVAFVAALAMVDAGYQVALMAPTEILANQHFQSFSKMFPERAHESLLLKGALTEKNKNLVRQKLADGHGRFVIGTQALLTDTTLFERLGLVIIDEQHRFGVEQRLGLKTHDEVLLPHLLVMTATPIPRSLALTIHGDLAMSVIREKPAGRQPIETHIVRRKSLEALAKRLLVFLAEGRQIYMVYPLVEESEELDLKDAQTAFKEWVTRFEGYQVGLLHGRMKSSDKDAVMKKFFSGEIRVLVSTTVIEVGVDVPNASVIVIEHAERFGLSQLHQLRGRVGRGTTKSYCVLVAGDAVGELAKERLSILEHSDDGFEMAEKDLEIRGPGEFLGRRQSGLQGFRVAQILRDQRLLELARTEAREILEADPQLQKPENRPIKGLVERWWKGRMELTLSG